jgi:hypothetical protein
VPPEAVQDGRRAKLLNWGGTQELLGVYRMTQDLPIVNGFTSFGQFLTFSATKTAKLKTAKL